MTNKCNCNDRLKARQPPGRCSKCSRVKMVFFLNNKHQNLKEHGCYPVRYSFYHKNKTQLQNIIAGMLRRYKDKEVYQASNKIIFYEFGNPVGEIEL